MNKEEKKIECLKTALNNTAYVANALHMLQGVDDEDRLNNYIAGLFDYLDTIPERTAFRLARIDQETNEESKR